MSQSFNISSEELDVLRKASEIIVKIGERQKGGTNTTAARKLTKKERIAEVAEKLRK